MFNLGAGRFGAFHNMILALESGNMDAAAGEAANSGWYTEVGPRGKRIVAMLRTGQWPDDVHYQE